MFCSTNAEGYMACCEALRDADLRPGLQGIRVPVLTVAGSHDPVTPPSDGHYLQQHIPAAKYAELPAAHLSNIEQAAVFTALMRQFVSVPQ
jgi:3-oxoadipate enol-lactonase